MVFAKQDWGEGPRGFAGTLMSRLLPALSGSRWPVLPPYGSPSRCPALERAPHGCWLGFAGRRVLHCLMCPERIVQRRRARLPLDAGLLPVRGGMGPASKRSPHSCKGLGTLRGEGAPAALHRSRVLHPQQVPHPTRLLPPCCPRDCPQPTAQTLPHAFRLPKLHPESRWLRQVLIHTTHRARVRDYMGSSFIQEPGSFPHTAAGVGSPRHPPPMGHPSLTSTGRGDEIAPSPDPKPRWGHGAKGLRGERSWSRWGTQTSLRARSSEGQVRGERRDLGHPPVHLLGGNRALAGPPQAAWLICRRPFVLLRKVPAVSYRSSPLEWR